MTKIRKARPPRRHIQVGYHKWLCIALLVTTVTIWILMGLKALFAPTPSVIRRRKPPPSSALRQKTNESPKEPILPYLVSSPDTTHVTASVRGNLGAPSVMVDPSVENWMTDRWQAASDLHGTAIKGAHWVELEFQTTVAVTKIVLDWEAANSDDYKLIGLDQDGTKVVLFDTQPQHDDKGLPRLSVHEYGQSPGVKTKTPLHILHAIEPIPETQIQVLRIEIRKPAKHGWGVSLWRVNVFGYEVKTPL